MIRIFREPPLQAMEVFVRECEVKTIQQNAGMKRPLMGAACFAALTGLAGFLRIPFFPVPLTLQTLMVYLSGCLLGKKYGMISQMVFLALGLIGLPIFSTGGGPGAVLQPTFGYLAAFPAGAWLIGWMIEQLGSSPRWTTLLLAHVPSLLLILGFGLLYLHFSMDHFMGRRIGLNKALLSGGVLFLPAELLKAAFSTVLYRKMKKPIQGLLFILPFLMMVQPVSAQTKTGLARIKAEIRKLEADIRAKEARETTLLEQLEDVDRKIGLQQKLMSALHSQQREKELEIRTAEARLGEADQSLQKHKSLVARRMVALYKKGRMAEWEALVSMKSVNQALVWIKYQKMILRNDRRNLQVLAQKEKDVFTQKTGLEQDLSEKQKLIEEVRSETVLLEQNKRERKQLLNVVRKEKEPLLEQLQQKKLAYQEIEIWIAREEERREAERRRAEEAARRSISTPERQVPPIKADELPDKFEWPARGRIVSGYGRHMDKQLKTWTENLGVEIETAENNTVCAAAGGQVRRVDWLRGMGNLVFLDHGGVYTVYGHLEEVYVNLGESVAAGKPIGKVGDRSSFYGSTLHFEVWKGKTHYNPEQWLK